MVQLSAASYDASVAGIDEASARAALADMQARLARDPAAALGLGSNPTTEDLRARFLELTKQFHPVRFGRMSIDIQKQSNEVFLALRAAQEAIGKTIRRRSGPIPTAPTVAPIGQRPASPSTPGPATSTTPANIAGKPLAAAVAATPAAGFKAVPPRANPVSGPPRTQPAVAAGRPGGVGQSGPIATTPATEASVLEMLQRQQWDLARTALHQLAARDPSSKKIRALASYARGREAQLGGRIDDARVELGDALDLDPDLAVAKTAMTELFTRRK